MLVHGSLWSDAVAPSRVPHQPEQFLYLLPLLGVGAFSAASFAVLARRAIFCFL
jgi:hypothetical protein